MKDLEKIKLLESELNVVFKPIRLGRVLFAYAKNSYSLDENGHVIGLNIRDNQLKKIPDIIYEFNSLVKFCAEDNQIEIIDPEINRLKHLKDIALRDNKIKQFPVELTEITELESITLRDNLITELPEQIEKLKKLKYFSLSRNQLEKLPLSIVKLESLIRLTLGYNQLETIPDELFKLKNLKYLQIENNRITSLPNIICNTKLDIQWKVHPVDRGIYLENNPLVYPPVEIAKQGKNAIINWFRQKEEQGTDFIYEAKLMILGEGGSGKTTLAWKVEDPDCPLPQINDRTRGITINPYLFTVKRKNNLQENVKFRLNIWDFGGQEMYHATHRFFLSKRSLYILVADNRKDSTHFDYWLDIIELYANESPVIIVLNEKDDIKKQLNKAEIRSRFEIVKEIKELNFCTFEEQDTNKRVKRLGQIQELRDTIEHLAKNLPHIGDAIPARWIDVRDEIEKSSLDYTDWKDFKRLCNKFNIVENQDIELLSSYFHDIGVLLHFQDNPILKKTVIFNPNWATTAVYNIFDDSYIQSLNGRFTRSTIFNVWNTSEYEDMQDELLELMKKFRLVYEVRHSQGELVAPQLLLDNQPDYQFDSQDAVYFRYQYQNFMPKGILWQAIVELSNLIKNQELVWKSGVILELDSARAEIIEKYNLRTIYIRITGTNKIALLSVIRNTLNTINETYFKLKVNQLVPCKCKTCMDSSEPHFYNYNDLLLRIEKGKQTIECYKSFEDVDVQQLVDIFIESNAPQKVDSENNQKRIRQLAEQLNDYYYLLNEYENLLITEIDPKQRLRYKKEVISIGGAIDKIEDEIKSYGKNELNLKLEELKSQIDHIVII